MVESLMYSKCYRFFEGKIECYAQTMSGSDGKTEHFLYIISLRNTYEGIRRLCPAKS